MLGWKRAAHASRNSSLTSFVSVIVPFRNEANTLAFLLEDLSKQKYLAFEIILVNDHSEDDSLKVISRICEKSSRLKEQVRVVHCTEHSGKKAALTLGIVQAKGDIILTTDADCRVGNEWVESMLSHFTDDTMMVVGGVRLSASSFFEKLQQLEFVSLIGSGAATLGWNLPSMANGANLAYRKIAFEKVGGYAGNEHIPSGDDEFLLRKIVDQYSEAVRFADHPTSIVETRPADTLKTFIQQRLRWAGKWRMHTGLFSKVLALSIFFFQLTFLTLPILLMFKIIAWPLALVVMGCKVVGEFLFLYPVSHRLGVKFPWLAFGALQFIYPYYVVAVGLLANGSKYTWKGRTF